MIRKIVSTACLALIAPLAFAGGTKQSKSMAYLSSAQGITVTGSTVLTVDQARAASYQPPGMLIIHDDADPRTYVVSGPGHVFNSKGERVAINLRPGSSVRVVFSNAGGVKTIDHVLVD